MSQRQPPQLSPWVNDEQTRSNPRVSSMFANQSLRINQNKSNKTPKPLSHHLLVHRSHLLNGNAGADALRACVGAVAFRVALSGATWAHQRHAEASARRARHGGRRRKKGKRKELGSTEGRGG